HMYMWEINMGPAGQGNNPLWISYNAGIGREEIAPTRQFLFFYGEPNATIMTFDPESDTVHITFIDARTEEVLFDRTFSYTDLP
ncbi:MAG: hypothetical protein JRG91_18245, partial [Deltaproteobacteria bacterium]|nr:hypothetical protein [Deltaproteobacteria bacterium]